MTYRIAGIDVHKKSLTVCVLPPTGKPGEVKTRVFGTFTRDLKQLRKWLCNCSVTEVAMESTGQYWRPVWNILEGHVAKLLLLNPYYVKALAGEKTDISQDDLDRVLDPAKMTGPGLQHRPASG